MGVGFPATLRLHEFGHKIYEVFGHHPYHVGSSVMLKTGWRDVDVRLMIEDDLYAAMGLGDPKRPQNNAKWCGLCSAFSAWGKEITGLPIDFQIQQLSLANREFGGNENVRSFLGLIPGKIVEAKSTQEPVKLCPCVITGRLNVSCVNVENHVGPHKDENGLYYCSACGRLLTNNYDLALRMDRRCSPEDAPEYPAHATNSCVREP